MYSTRGVFRVVIEDGEAGGEYKKSLATALNLSFPKGEKDFLGIATEDAPSLVFCSEAGISGDVEIGGYTGVFLLASFVVACVAGGEYSISFATALGLPPPNGEKDIFGGGETNAGPAPSIFSMVEASAEVVSAFGDEIDGVSSAVDSSEDFSAACLLMLALLLANSCRSASLLPGNGGVRDASGEAWLS